jgi:membrane-associated phospholipid phosphatase
MTALAPALRARGFLTRPALFEHFAEERPPVDRAALAPVDRLVLGFVAALALLTLVASDTKAADLDVLVCTAALVVAAAWSARAFRVGRILHDFAPIALVVLLFRVTGLVLAAVNPRRADAALASVDASLFSDLVAAWRGALGRPAWLTDGACILYLSFYALPVVMAVALYRGQRRRDFDAFVFDIVATFLVSFVGYIALPTSGPRLPRTMELEWLGGTGVTEASMWFLHAVEGNELDAFPSGHTAVSLVCVALGWRLFPPWRLPLVGAAAGIVFSTVYLSLHYVVDLVAGALLALAMPVLLPMLRGAFSAPCLPSTERASAVGW